jgi:hypothetical protein
VQQPQSERTDNYKKKPSGSPKGKGKPKKRRHAVTAWRYFFFSFDALLLVMCVGKGICVPEHEISGLKVQRLGT